MADWLTFLTGGAAGGVAGVVAGSVVGNVAQQLLQEWRDTKGDQRERERELRTDARALRDAKRVTVFPALDALFDATVAIRREVEDLMVALQSEHPADEGLFAAENALYSPKLGDAMIHLADAIVIIQREINAPDVVSLTISVDDLYREFDQEASQYREDTERPRQRRLLLSLLQEMDADAGALLVSVLASKAKLEEPL